MSLAVGSKLGPHEIVAPDGQHFLMIKEKEAPPSSKEVSIVLHWTDELKRLAPRQKSEESLSGSSAFFTYLISRLS